MGAAGSALASMDEGRFRLLQRLFEDAAWVGSVTTWLFFAGVAAAAAASVRIPQLFPRPLEPAAIRATPGPSRLRAAQVRLLGPAPAWLGFGLGGWIVLMAVNRWRPALVLPVMLGYLLLELTLAILFFRVAYARGDEGHRRRIYWFLEAGLIAVASLAVGFWVELAVHFFPPTGPVVRWLHAVVLPAGFLVTYATIGFAILYKGALDPRLAVRRTLLYGLVGFVLTALFVGVETLVEGVLAARLDLPDTAGSYVAGFIAAIVFGPLRTSIDKRLSG